MDLDKVGLVIPGRFEGLGTIGVLQKLTKFLEERHSRIHYISSNSTGTLLAAVFLSDPERSVEALKKKCLELTPENIYDIPLITEFRNDLKQMNFWKKAVWFKQHIPLLKKINHFVFGESSVSERRDFLNEVLTLKHPFSLKPLMAFLAKHINLDVIFDQTKSDFVRFEFVTNIPGVGVKVFRNFDIPEKNKFASSKEEFYQGICASPAVPLFFPPVIINGIPHNDCYLNNAPINLAAKAGCDTIFISSSNRVKTTRTDWNWLDHIEVSLAEMIAFTEEIKIQKVREINLRLLEAGTNRPPSLKDKKIIDVVEIKFPVKRINFFNVEKTDLTAVIASGREAASQVLKELQNK